MKFTKSILMIGLMTVCGYAHAVNVTPQIQRLLNEKQEKMAELEKCEGKKKGFMIAGISTIGLTAGGIALNIVQANKISNLNEELDSKNKELTQKQGELSRLNTQSETSTTTSTETTKTAVNQSNNKSESGLPDVNTDGSGYGYYDIDGDHNYTEECSVSNPGEWCVTFPNNMVVSGVAVCNNTAGTYAVASNDEQTETGGVKCWCKMTDPAVSRWVFCRSYSSASVCSNLCAYVCGDDVRNRSDFRSVVFGSVAQ